MTLKRRERALFLDRDGTLTQMTMGQYVNHWQDLKLIDNVAECLLPFQRAGWKLFVVTNQPGLAMGHFNQLMLNLMNARLMELLANEGVFLTRIYTCTHAKDAGCKCRKPRPGLLARAAVDYGVSCRRSWMVGDFFSDIAAGNALSCKTALVDCWPEYNQEHRYDNDLPTIVCKSTTDCLSLTAELEGIR